MFLESGFEPKMHLSFMKKRLARTENIGARTNQFLDFGQMLSSKS